MTVIRVKVPLEQTEYTALLKMAQIELRSADDQIRFILRQELTHRGFLQPDDMQYQKQKKEAQDGI